MDPATMAMIQGGLSIASSLGLGAKKNKNAGKVDLTTTQESSGSSTFTGMNEQGQAALADVLRSMMESKGTAGAAFTKGAAVADSEGAMSDAINQVLAQGIGGAMAGQLQSGTYGSSYGAFAMNDLATQAASAGASLRLNTITNYGQLFQSAQQQFMNSLMQALTLNAETNKATSEQSKSTKTEKGFDMRGSGGGAGASPATGLLAASKILGGDQLSDLSGGLMGIGVEMPVPSVTNARGWENK